MVFTTTCVFYLRLCNAMTICHYRFIANLANRSETKVLIFEIRTLSASFTLHDPLYFIDMEIHSRTHVSFGLVPGSRTI